MTQKGKYLTLLPKMCQAYKNKVLNSGEEPVLIA